MWEIWAAGNNAWGQLDLGDRDRSEPEPADYEKFRRVLGPVRIEPRTLMAGEFRTHVKDQDGAYIVSGEEDTLLEMIEYAEKPAVDPRTLKLKELASRHYPQLLQPGGIAMAGTGRIIDIKGIQSQLPPSSSPSLNPPTPLHLPPNTTSIVAGATHFACLSAGHVYTWGDARHPSPLGHPPSSSASQPTLVSSLTDALAPDDPVIKIAAGGYVTAALTESGDCYIWGQGWAEEPEPVDMQVREVGVGEEGVVVVDEGGWGVG